MSFESREAFYIEMYNENKYLEDLAVTQAGRDAARRLQASAIRGLDELYKEYFDGISSSNA